MVTVYRNIKEKKWYLMIKFCLTRALQCTLLHNYNVYWPRNLKWNRTKLNNLQLESILSHNSIIQQYFDHFLLIWGCFFFTFKSKLNFLLVSILWMKSKCAASLTIFYNYFTILYLFYLFYSKSFWLLWPHTVLLIVKKSGSILKDWSFLGFLWSDVIFQTNLDHLNLIT